MVDDFDYSGKDLNNEELHRIGVMDSKKYQDVFLNSAAEKPMITKLSIVMFPVAIKDRTMILKSIPKFSTWFGTQKSKTHSGKDPAVHHHHREHIPRGGNP